MCVFVMVERKKCTVCWDDNRMGWWHEKEGMLPGVNRLGKNSPGTMYDCCCNIPSLVPPSPPPLLPPVVPPPLP